ncbi:(2Fe-2S) ferredoxin domain-containing protein [Candidatus Woesearchaeota archaeon]|nr:(2Fe-2S) ferredoxin domain-containing protein [Candidatus Woesearchaeota archaeon]
MELSPVRYQRHIFVCVNEKDYGKECCGFKQGPEILQILRDHVNKSGLVGKYNITKSRCLGHCLQGPTIAIYPEGKIFVHVTVEDTKRIIEEFLR